jgi:hypothetical protein
VTLEIADAQGMWDGEPGWLNTASCGLPPRVGWDALQRGRAAIAGYSE